MADIPQTKGNYEVEFDNLVLATRFPVLHRTVTLETAEAVKRGQLIAFDSGKYVPASDTATAVCAIAAADHETPEGGSAAIDAYVSGLFSAAHTVGPKVTEAVKVAAQQHGIYLV